jgi:uncharacterized protein (TIGR02147 family)
MKTVFTYLNYREFLKDYYEEQKATNPHFSYRYFSRLAGIKSSAFFKLVIQGDRGLTPSSTQQFLKALKLSKKESRYFEALVLFNQAKNDESKKLYFERLMTARPSVKFEGIQKDQYEYYTKGYYVTIREMVAMPDFEEDAQWIAKRLNPKITTSQAAHAVEVLERLGFLMRNEEGKLVQNDSAVATDPIVASHEVFRFQCEMLDKAKDALCNFPVELVELSSVTIPIQPRNIEKIKERIRKFQEDMVSLINKGSDDYSGVFQVNMQMFPLTEVKKCKK